MSRLAQEGEGSSKRHVVGNVEQRVAWPDRDARVGCIPVCLGLEREGEGESAW